MLAYVSHRLGNTRSSICCIVCLFGRHKPWDGCITLRWRHNGCDNVSNHQPRECLLRRAHQRKHQSSASLAFVRGSHRRPVNSPHKWPVTRKMFPFDDVIMNGGALNTHISSNTFQHCLNSISTNITWSFYELHSDYVPNLQIIYLINTDLYPNDFVFNHCGFWIKIANDTEPRWWNRKYCLLIFMTPCAGDHLIMMFPSSAGFCGAADQIACLFHMVEFNP